MARQWMARRAGWAILGSLAFAISLACNDEAAAPKGASTTSAETAPGGSGGTAMGGSGGTATGGSGGAVGGSGGSGGGVTDGGGAGGETGSEAASSMGGEAAAGGEAATGGGGGTDGLNYVPVQRREDGDWPDLGQIWPHELGDDDAKCRITQRASEGGEFIQSWTWQYNESNGQPIRLTHETADAGDRTAVFDEQGHYWSVCDEETDSRCTFFEAPTSVEWDSPYPYARTCPGTPPEAGFEQRSFRCEVPFFRDEQCPKNVPYQNEQPDFWQFAEDGRLRRHVPENRIGIGDVDCYIDGVLRVTGEDGDFNRWRDEMYPDGRLERDSWSDIGEDLGEDYTRCDEAGWIAEFYVREQDDDWSEGRSITERYSFHGDDPLRPDEVVFEFEQTDLDCIPPIDRSGTLTATLEWTSDSVEIHPIASTDPSLQAVTWSGALTPGRLSARLDDAGNVVEVFPTARSNLRDLGIRELEPSLIGVYTFEGAGDCLGGTNPHLLVGTRGVLPYQYAPESCSTGQVTVTGYEQVCADYGPDE